MKRKNFPQFRRIFCIVSLFLSFVVRAQARHAFVTDGEELSPTRSQVGDDDCFNFEKYLESLLASEDIKQSRSFLKSIQFSNPYTFKVENNETKTVKLPGTKPNKEYAAWVLRSTMDASGFFEDGPVEEFRTKVEKKSVKQDGCKTLTFGDGEEVLPIVRHTPKSITVQLKPPFLVELELRKIDDHNSTMTINNMQWGNGDLNFDVAVTYWLRFGKDIAPEETVSRGLIDFLALGLVDDPDITKELSKYHIEGGKEKDDVTVPIGLLKRIQSKIKSLQAEEEVKKEQAGKKE